MTRAPRSASWRVQNGAAIACSSVTTVMPSRGVFVGHRGPQNDRGRPSTCSATYDRIRLVEIGATWYSRVSRNLRSTSYSQAKPKPPWSAGRRWPPPRGLGGQVLGHVGLGAAGLVGVEQAAGLPAHQVGGLDLDVGLGDRELHALVLADRPAEHHALLDVRTDRSMNQ
jgi:hypothetical protein